MATEFEVVILLKGPRGNSGFLQLSRQHFWTTSSAIMSQIISRAAKKIRWLFLNPVNEEAFVKTIQVSGHDWIHMEVEDFIEGHLAPKMRDWFSFDPQLSSVAFWIVSSSFRYSSQALNSHSSASKPHRDTRRIRRMGPKQHRGPR